MKKLIKWLNTNKVRPSTLARNAGVAPSTITRILSGEHSPSLAIMRKIEKATFGAVKMEDWG